MGTSSNKLSQTFFEVKIPKTDDFSRSEVKIISPIDNVHSDTSLHEEHKASIEEPAEVASLISSEPYEVSEADDETYDVESLT